MTINHKSPVSILFYLLIICSYGSLTGCDEPSSNTTTITDPYECTTDYCNCLEHSSRWCENRCSREGQRMFYCKPYGHQTYVLAVSSECTPNSDGELDYTFSDLQYCTSCEDAVCHIDESSKGLDLSPGDKCSNPLFQRRCSNDHSYQLLTCNISDEVVAYECPQRNDTCRMFSPDPQDPKNTEMGTPKCTIETCTTEGETKTVKVSVLTVTYVCTKALDGQLYYAAENW